MKKIFGLISKTFLQFSALALATPVLAQAGSPTPGFAGGSLKNAIDGISNAVAGIAGAVAVLFLIYGGITYIIGGEAGSKSGRAIITNSLIGLAIVILAFVIVKFITTALGV